MILIINISKVTVKYQKRSKLISKYRDDGQQHSIHLSTIAVSSGEYFAFVNDPNVKRM